MNLLASLAAFSVVASIAGTLALIADRQKFQYTG
jgi:hypothetical protein